MVESTGTHVEVPRIDSVCSGFTKVSQIPLGDLCQWDQAKESWWMQYPNPCGDTDHSMPGISLFPIGSPRGLP